MLDAVCIKVGYIPDVHRATYSWDYIDGCFENGAYTHFIQAKPGNVYDFSRLPIEVRQTTNIPSAVVNEIEAEEDAAGDTAALSQGAGIQQETGSGAATTFTVLGHIFMLLTLAAGAEWTRQWYKKDNGIKQ